MFATTVDNYRDAPAVNQAMGRVYAHMMLAVIRSEEHTSELQSH